MMTADEFVTWLKGFTDFSNPQEITQEQWMKIRYKLDNVATRSSLLEPKTYDDRFISTSIYSNPQGRGILSCSLSQPRIGFRTGDDS